MTTSAWETTAMTKTAFTTQDGTTFMFSFDRRDVFVVVEECGRMADWQVRPASQEEAQMFREEHAARQAEMEAELARWRAWMELNG